MAKHTERLDILVHQRGLAPSREKARAMIMAGEVSVNGNPSDKPGTQYPLDIDITLKSKPRFVSRGGDKLQGALDVFGLSPQGHTCADVGASTGGFTDCLLKAGAAKVYAIDVGYGILDASLRNDPRVVVMERTNARSLETLPEPVKWVVVDASFISLKLILPVFKAWVSQPAEVIALIKPQFEAGKKDVDKGKGVIRDPRIHQRVLDEVLTFALGLGYTLAGLRRSPLLGPAGNVEFLAWLRLGAPSESLHLAPAIEAALHPAESPTE